jgi:RsiW-degrading membrane proteinase PrsW (M82 family)
MEYLNYLSLILPPLFAVLIYFYLRYKYSTRPSGLLFRAFLWGGLSILLVLGIQFLAGRFGLDSLGNLRRILFYSLVIAGFFSEFGKFFILKVLIYPKQELRSPVDGIIYAVMVSLGFATANNFLILFNIPQLEVNLVNAFSAGPANLIFGVLMGFFMGLGKLRQVRFVDSMTSLGAAVLFHAIYAFCLLTHDNKLLLAFFAGSGIIAFSLCLAAIRMHDEAKSEGKI